MSSVSTKLRIVTPLMVGGYDESKDVDRRNRRGKQVKKEIIRKANLNINSFRGNFRWWFRALHGWRDDLLTLEEDIFGSTKKASPVKMSLEHQLTPLKWNDEIKAKSFGSYDLSKGRRGFYDGLTYFGYNNLVYNARESSETIREYYNPGDTFNLKIIGHEDILQKYLVLAWVSLQFGGIGNRSRRCFGNLSIETQRIEKFNGNQFYFKNSYKSLEEYKKVVSANRELITMIFMNNHVSTNEISTLKNAELFLSKEVAGNDWKEAINFAGATMQKFRALRPPEHDELKNIPFEYLKLKRPIFGLPLQFRFLNAPNVTLNQVEIAGERIIQTRLASPIIVSVVLINNKFHIQYLILSRNYDNLKVKAIRRNERKDVKIDHVNAKEEFIEHLRTFELNSKTYHYQQIF